MAKARASKKITTGPSSEPATPDGEARDPKVEFDGPILGTFGVTGLKRYGGYVSEAEEWNPKLKGKKGDKLYREMEDNDALLGGATLGMEFLARQVEWRVDAKKDSGEAGKELADWFEGDRTDTETPFEGQVSSIMSAPVYGWALMEELWKIRRGPNEELPELRSQFSDGLYGTRDVVIRAQQSRERWEFASDGTLVGMWQKVDTDSRMHFIPMAKALLFRIRERQGSPEGRSLYRNAVRAYHFTTTLEEEEAIGLSRKNKGLPIARLPVECFYKSPPANMRELRAYFEDFVKNIALDTVKGGVIPTDELPGNGGKTGVKFGFEPMPEGDLGAMNTAIARWQTDKLIALLWQFLLLGSGEAAGSWSLSSEMTDIIAMAINAILRMISGIFTRTHYPRLGRLNGFDPRILPELAFTDIEKPDVVKLWQAMQAFTAAGGVMDDSLENFGREQSGWPKREPGAVLQRPMPSPTTPVLPTKRSRLLHPGRILTLPGLGA